MSREGFEGKGKREVVEGGGGGGAAAYCLCW